MVAVPPSLKRAALGLVLVDVAAVVIIASTLQSVRDVADRNEQQLVTLVREVTRASQAQAAAERMVAIGRGYLLTVEPELLARSQAAEAKLARTLQAIAAGHEADGDVSQLEPVLSSATRYRDTFSALLYGEVVPSEPRDVAQALRKQVIPARDDLLGELDELIAAKLRRLEAGRVAAREQHTKSMSLVVMVGAIGVLASAFLLSILLAGVRAVISSSQSEQPASRTQPPSGSRLASVYRFPRTGRTPPPAA